MQDIPVCERGDNQPGRVSQVLVRVLELSITDVGKAVSLLLIPPAAMGGVCMTAESKGVCMTAQGTC